MFGYEDKTTYCIYTSKQTFEMYVDLLSLQNSKNSHYVLIKDFDKLWLTKQSIIVKSISVNITYNAALAKKYYKVTENIFLEEGAYIKFKNFKRLTNVSFIIYGNFEYILVPLTDNISFGPNAKKYQDHIVI